VLILLCVARFGRALSAIVSLATLISFLSFLFARAPLSIDQLNIGIDCFGICGDADGDGDAGRTSATLAMIGGLDLPNLAGTESFVIAIDLNLDVADVLPSFVPNLIVPFDYIIGVPGGQPADAEANPMPGSMEVPFIPCSVGATGNDLFGMRLCFGLYNYQLTAAVPLARRMLSPATDSNGTVWPTNNYNPTNALDWPTQSQPDLEWAIGQVANLRATKGAGFTRSNKEPWSLLIQAFSGSFQDAGIGEDYVPSQTDYDDIQFPCLELDACDVCLGDNSTCLDCAGVPNGARARVRVCSSCIHALRRPQHLRSLRHLRRQQQRVPRLRGQGQRRRHVRRVRRVQRRRQPLPRLSRREQRCVDKRVCVDVALTVRRRSGCLRRLRRL
jgi:hypothetical protein